MLNLDVTVKDSDEEREEEKTIPDCAEEGTTTFVYSVVSLVRHRIPLEGYISSKVLCCNAICLP